ncbi:MAG: DUF4145 domain-containing protein [Planctomycetaceae bacterium]|nr:DUF4145 domain-containing protein [Planctomycetaceae bacterium]
MKVLLQHSQLHFEFDERRNVITDPVDGFVYEFLECDSCERHIIQRFHWTEMWPMVSDDIEYEVVSPAENSMPRGLPQHLHSAWEAAERVKSIDANAYGVLGGRLLDLVCTDQKATGETLFKRLNNLGDSGQIPKGLVDVAHGLRKLRNVAAHADLGDLTSQEVPLLDALLKAVLEYVYTAPQLVEDVQARLQEVEKRNQET